MADVTTAQTPRPAVAPKRRKGPVLTGKKVSLVVLFLPAAALLILFHYVPIYGILISFKKFSPYQGILRSPWAGLFYFKSFLLDPKFWSVIKNTLVISGLDILFGFPAPILFALLANEIYFQPFKKTMQTISYLPHFLSWVVVASVFYQFLSPMSGLVNMALIRFFHVEPISFLLKRQYFRTIVVFAEIWKNVGWGAILYFATIAGIDTTLYEAAYADGAGRVRMAWVITLPMMMPIIVLMLILRVSSIFVVGFERIFTFANPVTYEVSDVISVYVYRTGLEQAQYSLTSAIGLVQSALGFVLVFAANRLSARITGLGLW
jgi:putative aldouronate transport system permease protein